MDLAALDTRSEEGEKTSQTRIRLLGDSWKSRSDLEKVLEPTVVPFYPESGQLQRTGVGFRRQVMVMTKRSIKTTLRDPMGMVGCILQAMVMGLGYGWIFFRLGTDQAGIRSREGAIYIAIYQSYLTLMFEIYRLTAEIRLFDMERRDGVASVPAFLVSRRLSKILFEDIPIPTIFAAIFYFMVGLRNDSASFGIFLAVIVASNYSAVNLASLCVALSRKFAVASLLGNLLFTFHFLCCGWVIQTNQLPIYFRWLKWAVSNLSLHLEGGN